MADLDKHLNLTYNGTSPLALGDRYYAQDLIRDLTYSWDLTGQTIKRVLGHFPALLQGGAVTMGAGDTLNITEAWGICSYDVEVPDTFAALPPSKMTITIVRKVHATAQTNLAMASATKDGATPNYIKLAYTETDGNTRTRARAVGTYSYERVPSFTYSISAAAPTDYEVSLGTVIIAAGGAGPWTLEPVKRRNVKDNIPSGSIFPYSGLSAPIDYLLCDGSAISKTIYATLWNSLSSSTRGTAKTGACTFTDAGDSVTCNGHGFATGDCIHFSVITTTTGISIDTNYYVIYAGVNTFTIATSFDLAIAGTKTTFSSNGSGSIVYAPWGISTSANFLLPDGRGLTLKGVGQQGTASWGAAAYTGNLGHYKQDKFQGHYHDEPDYSTYTAANDGNSYLASANATNKTYSTPNTLGPITDGTNGTPRTGTTTEMQSMGVNYIIKYT